MAFQPIQINPIDLQESVAVGVNLPFAAPSVFASNYQTKDAIKNNLVNFFLTNPGERPLNPSFGGGLRAFIFAQLTNNNLDFLQEDLSAKVATYFPNVKVNDLVISGDFDNGQVNISLTYSVINTNITDTLLIQFQ